MKTVVTVNTKTHSGIPWPDDVPLPSTGDSVILRIQEETLAFRVKGKLYSIGVDPQTLKPLALITISGKRAAGAS